MIPKCIEFLHNLKKDPTKTAANADPVYKNWMMYCSINIPHPAFNTNATWLKYVNMTEVESQLPTWLPRESFHPADAYQSISKNVWGNFSDADIIKVRRTYYAMCAETDYMLGLVLKALRDSGHEDNTYVIFLSDHGEMNMEHRQVWKNSMYEASERVPLIISGPKLGVQQGKVISSLTSLLDVYPTLLQMASPDTPLPEFLDGYSLMPLLKSSTLTSTTSTRGGTDSFSRYQHQYQHPSGEYYPHDRAVVAQYHSNMGNTGSFMIRKGPWKYIAFGNDPTGGGPINGYDPQLFNVQDDPSELTDLAQDEPRIAAALDKELRQVVDYDSVDAQAKANDKKLYMRYFNNTDAYSLVQLRKKFEQTYSGFDDADWSKIQAWINA